MKEKIVFSINVVGPIGYVPKTGDLDLHLQNSKCTIGLNVKSQIIKLPEENSGEKSL